MKKMIKSVLHLGKVPTKYLLLNFGKIAKTRFIEKKTFLPVVCDYRCLTFRRCKAIFTFVARAEYYFESILWYTV